MTMDVTNRETIRDALYTLLSSGLVGAGKYVQSMTAYEPDPEEIKGKSPVAWISSGPTQRIKTAISLRTKSGYVFVFQVAVRLDGTLTPAQVDDRLDLIEKEAADILLEDANRSTANWSNMEIGESTPGYTMIGGSEYRIELTPITIDGRDG